MRKVTLLVAVVVMGVAGLLQAAEGELHGVVDVTYQSKYIWRGFDAFDDKSAIQSSVDLDLFGTGFGINVMMHRANSSEFENAERWDYSVYYGNKLFADEVYATNYRVSYVYYNFPDSSSHTVCSTDLQEVNAMLSWPKVCPFGVVPSYVIVKMWPSNSDSPVSEASGFAHIFMLDYGLKLQDIAADLPAQVLNLHTELVYNDGVDPRPGSCGVDHDWSNIVFGISTDFEVAQNLILRPAVGHQITMDKSVNDDKDETWANLSMMYKF